MRYKYLLISILLFFTACGSGNGSNAIQEPKEALKHDITFKHSQKIVTIYVHGFKSDGYYREGIYGDEYSSNFIDNLLTYTKYQTLNNYDVNNPFHIITGVEYYGNLPPKYYTQKDIEDINSTTNGIPRYALIVAKYIKYILNTTKAERVNIISASMGSLITRYMIEKNLENLSSDKKIEQWMSTEGVIRGNYAITESDKINSSMVKELLDSFFQNSPETKQMKYEWIDANLTKRRDTMASPYYKDILVGEISLTDSDTGDGIGVKYILQLNGKFKPHDGYQLVRDTYFQKIENYLQVPSHTLIHINHESINDSTTLYASISAFLEAKKRVRITLIDATINALHERITPTINENAEIVFENNIYSPKVKERWGINTLISQRVYNSGILPIHHYKSKKQKKEFEQILFDDFVLEDETKLEVEIKAYEIDRSTKYNLNEVSTKSKEELSGSKISIDLKDGVYPIVSDEWSGHIKVEVVKM